ncbi:hydroxypyruvate isomerase family protein [Paenibacillus nasutitermitis]|uniref:Hydroxypyruvate isomerase n=1 Tax=Paenibacillus nasutitermitis TaxID=1652958 RepID=A0A917E1B4_9BACL|nr:TIM barrel protein [Paenibacillus nasutitermitis]GGD89082.1 hydroxypyruvate isomerase [Paenibacillus nasutitermitis]
MRLSICLDAVYRGYNLEEALTSIKQSGFDTFEFWSWWDKDLNLLSELKNTLGLTISCFCTKSESLVDESKREEYIEGLRESIAVAGQLGCSKLITQVGSELEGVSRERQSQSLIDGLKACVPLLSEAGITLLVEPLNLKVDHAGYFLARSDEAFAIIDAVGSRHVQVLFDIYHQQVTEGDLIRTITANAGSIGHFHAAGHPGRHELDTGEIRYEAVFAAISASGYDGDVGLEYFPLEAPAAGLQSILNQYGSIMK